MFLSYGMKRMTDGLQMVKDLVAASFVGSLSGNASTATTLQKPQEQLEA